MTMTAIQRDGKKPRKRNPRRLALERVTELHKLVQGMVWRWRHVPSLNLYADPGADKRTWHQPARKRADIPPEEYIENDPRYWAELYNTMDAVAKQAASIQKFAYEQFLAKGGKVSRG